MSAAHNDTRSMWLCVSGYCLKSAFLIAIIAPLRASCAVIKSPEGSFGW